MLPNRLIYSKQFIKCLKDFMSTDLLHYFNPKHLWSMYIFRVILEFPRKKILTLSLNQQPIPAKTFRSLDLTGVPLASAGIGTRKL